MVDESAQHHQLVAAMLRSAGRVLLCHRTPLRQWYPDSWDLPGGHTLDGELRPLALRRELREELGIDIAPPTDEPFAHVQGPDFRMDIWAIDEWTGKVANLALDEHDGLAWVDARQASGLRLADPRLLLLIEAVLA